MSDLVPESPLVFEIRMNFGWYILNFTCMVLLVYSVGIFSQCFYMNELQKSLIFMQQNFNKLLFQSLCDKNLYSSLFSFSSL